MATQRVPVGLGDRGRRMWKALHSKDGHQLSALEDEVALEACRIADRLDRLDEVLRGDTDTWMRLVHNTRTNDYELKIDSALSESRQQANQLKQLVASLRLPDEQSGKRPQPRGGNRGAYRSRGAGAKVSSLDRARASKSG